MSQIDLNKAIIQRYFEAYNSKNEAIFDEIISPDYIDHGQSAYMGALRGEELLELRMTSRIL
ncbi:MAG: nuclear transport factor 2 family protein [Thermoproteota archaeon]|nr:nuclear transport factor 2 family protein [Thermoproteota archaeon]